MLPRTPSRRTEPEKHLPAELARVERALLHRADKLEASSAATGNVLLLLIALEWRELADEIHWQP
jgi:hypothetical protein